MSDNFTQSVVNGIDIRSWDHGHSSGVNEARSLAGRLPRGGEYNNDRECGSISRIEAPVSAGGTTEVWLDGDGFIMFDIPDEYVVESVSSFESSYTCITLSRSD